MFVVMLCLQSVFVVNGNQKRRTRTAIIAACQELITAAHILTGNCPTRGS
jgi:hypothetical protein